MSRRLFLLLPLALAGCDLAPHYRRPAPMIPSQFSQGPAYPALGAGGDVAAIGWRRFFTDPRLATVIGMSLAHNQDIQLALATIAQARAQYRIQRADLFPTLGVAASASGRRTASNGASAGISGSGLTGSTGTAGTGVTTGTTGTGTSTGTGTGGTSGSGSLIGATTGTAAGRTIETYGLTATIASWEIDLFGRIRNLSRAALDQYLATRAARDATQISLIAEVATAWLTLASDQDQLRLSRETRAAYAESLRITRAQFTRGVVSELDVRQADTAFQSARADVAQRTSQIAQDQNALNLLAGTTVPAALLPAALGEAQPTLADLPAGLDSGVLLNRPDVIQAEDQLRAENANIGAARAAFFPSISLTAAAGTASGGLAGLFAGGSWSWNASGSVVQTLFDFGRRRAELRYAEASRDAAVARYRQAVQTAFRDVSDALAVRGTIAEQIAAQGARVVSARRAALLSDARYRAGIDPYLTALDTQRTAYAAEQTLASTRLARATNLVTLYTALGGGLRPDDGAADTGSAPAPAPRAPGAQ
ncbi:efflux transporter outer membrane subunit [Sphingomonas morindae]|uniref:Efflux transporter outer membrane subunit n=1 Tax=Sphingomonas morindae TaxID=1541170 RepID=A0ABY4XAH9_9SPHN|nr:efflux transporter outer membrane subunit [Sphingomonas morindae]USI73960.1 efflux transporter outer membrane subunit [Sphingomonas morindae]